MNDAMNNPILAAINDCLSGTANHPSLESRVLARVNGKRRGPVRLSAAMALALALTLLAAAALAVGALTGLFKLEQADWGAMRDCVSTGDTLYLLSSGGMYTWTPDESEPALLLSDEKLHENGLSFEALLYRNGDAIGMLDQESKTLWECRNGELTLLLDYSGTPMELSNMRYESVVYQDGWLFLTAQPLEDAMKGGALLYRADPLNGQMEQLSIAGTLELCGYEPGEVLVLQRNDAKREDSLVTLDTSDGTIQKTLYTTHVQGIEGIAYDKARGGLYALVDGRLSCWETDVWKALQGYASHHLTNAYAIVGGGYVSVSFNGMQYVPFDWESDLVTLTIRGYMASYNADEDFQEVNSGMAVVRKQEPTLTAKDVRQAIEEGDTTDLFHLRMDGDLAQLIRDGVIAPLASSNLLISDAQAVIPVIQKNLFYQGQLYAVPSLILPAVWQGEYLMPETYEDLLASITEAGSDSPVIADYGAESPWTKKDYANYLLETYIAEYARKGKALRFRDEAFINTLTALKHLALPSGEDALTKPIITSETIINLRGTAYDTGEQSCDQEAQPLSDTNTQHWMLPPTIIKDAQPTVSVHLIVYLLNPNAQNPEAAIKYLEYVATHRALGEDGLLKPDKAEPVLYPAIERMIRFIIQEQHQSDAEAGVETDEDVLKAQMDSIRSAPDSWEITENKLSDYIENILPYIELRLSPYLSVSAKMEGGVYQRMLQAINSYVNGDLTIEQCLTELEVIVVHH